jgi:hypothetical protein
MSSVPEKSSVERRRSPRVEIFAQAEVVGQEIYIMEVRNISTTGVFLEGPPDEYPDLTPGLELDLAIFANEEGTGSDDPDANVACRARIVRIDPGDPGQRPPGIGATIDPIDDENRARLAGLLLRAG